MLEINPDGIHCFQRSFSGQRHFFTVPINDDYVVVGVAKIGPNKQPTDLPPKLNVEELLAPLPEGTPIVPMTEPEPVTATVPVTVTVKRPRGRPRKNPPA